VRILLVEDEADLGNALRRAFEEERHVCDLVRDGRSGLVGARHGRYDVVVLDIMLPGMDGLTVLARLREEGIEVPVLLLTARGTLGDRVTGLDSGADDYLTKPFALEELFARVRALARRSVGQPSPLIRVADVELDTASRTVRRGGAPVALTAKEYALLELLVLRRGRLVTRSAIYDHLYGERDATLSNVVEVYVANLRRKLGKEFIRTRRGDGYLVP